MSVFAPVRNPSREQIVDLIGRSKHAALRRIVDPRNGDVWVWRAEEATHTEGAASLSIPYDRRPGEGDVITL